MRRLLISLTMVMALLATTVSVNAEKFTVEGFKAYHAGDYEEAARLFRIAADRGWANAAYVLGILYESGLGVPQDDTEAVKLFLKAAEKRHGDAAYQLGEAYENGLGVAQDYSEAADWYRKSAYTGNKEAEAWLRNKAEEGFVYAQIRLAKLYSDKQEFAEAAKWHRKLAEQGDASARSSLGVRFQRGDGVAMDLAEAVKWFREAADQGDARGQLELGLMYWKGEGVAQDYAEAAKWLRKAADRGGEVAQFNLAYLYQQGWGVTQDNIIAYLWFSIAAERGLESAIGSRNQLEESMSADDIAEGARRARMCIDSEFQNCPNSDEAHTNGERLLAQDQKPDVVTDGRALQDDVSHISDEEWVASCDNLTANVNDPERKAAPVEFKEMDAATAVSMCQTAVEIYPDSPRLKLNLGRAYNRLENFAESLNWTSQAAEAGYAYAYFAMGIHYSYGEGVAKDDIEETKWYRKAADEGVAISQHYLGVNYEEGKGVPQDYVQSHMWYNLAVSRGREESATNRDDIAEKMTSDQIAEAQRLAREWKPMSERCTPIFGLFGC